MMEIKKGGVSMTKQSRESRGAALGALLIVFLLAAVIGGGFLVYRGAQGASKKRDVQAAQAAPSAAPASSEQTPAAPEQTPKAPVRTLDAQVEEVAPAAPETVTLMAVGDDLIHNTIYWSAEQEDGSYDFTPVYETFSQIAAEYDLACINQETIFVNDPALYANYPAFGTPVQVGDALVQAGFDVVTCATNHCYDKRETGILDTIGFWRENYPEVTLLGIHDSQEDADTLRVVEKNGIRIAMLNYTYGLNYGAPEKQYMVDVLLADHVAADLEQAEREADFTIVFAHWGEEGQFTQNQFQRDWAQRMADGGADLIIGAHPHVVQPLGAVSASDGREVPVFYSLGNFVSHQLDASQMLGGMASVELTRTENGVEITRCELLPTINVIMHRGYTGGFDYQPMLLRDYTAELAETHWIGGTGVDDMWALWKKITGE